MDTADTGSGGVGGVVSREFAWQCWTESASPSLEGRLATQYALSNGFLGLRGTHEEMPPWASPGFYVAGTYTPGPRDKLIAIHSADHILTHPERIRPEHHADYRELVTLPNLPNPVVVRLRIDGELVSLDQVTILSCERILHMREAILTRRLTFRDRSGRRVVVDSERLVSRAQQHVLAFRYSVRVDGSDAFVSVEPYIKTDVVNGKGARLFAVTHEESARDTNTIAVGYGRPVAELWIVQAYARERGAGSADVSAIVAVASQREDAERMAHDGLEDGFEAVRSAHVCAVASDWSSSGVELEGDALTRQGLRFGLQHLDMAICRDRSEVSVPIKGLTGEGYRFMVFWDTEFHMFPYYVMVHPAHARNLLLYRHRLLDAARRNARQHGYQGAQIPWETAITGDEETAPWLNLQERELHISADVAYAVHLYDEITGDDAFLEEFGAEIVFETARFYASRVAWNSASGRYELLAIGCPDQYHTLADNNVFISQMARWNLAYAADLARQPRAAIAASRVNVTPEEGAAFQRIADGLYVIPANQEGIVEEFEGFFNLSTDLRGVSETFCSHTQAVKQPDVVATFVPFRRELTRQLMQKNWRYYEARTLHGSSLSLPGMALGAAVGGMPDEAADYFLRAARMDLDDINLNTNLGVHLAGYGVLWQTLVYGFGGMTATRSGLAFAPCMPARWPHVSFAVHWRGQRADVTVRPGEIRVRAADENTAPVPVTVGGKEGAILAAGQEVVCAL